MNKILKYKIGNSLYRRDELTNQYKTKKMSDSEDLILKRKDNGNVITAQHYWANFGQIMA